MQKLKPKGRNMPSAVPMLVWPLTEWSVAVATLGNLHIDQELVVIYEAGSDTYFGKS